MIYRMLVYLLSFLVALTRGLIANLLGLPIPWLLGSLLAVSFCSLKGLPIRSASFSRKIGLMIIGISLGLYFTPDMIDLLSQHFYLMLAVAIFSISLGIIGSIITFKLSKVSYKTAWFASVIGGASEMSNLAQFHRARVDQVVASHLLRVFLVVTIVPFFYTFMGYHSDDGNSIDLNQTISLIGLIILFALSTAGAKIFELINWSNPWTFAPLIVAAGLTSFDVHLSSIPPILSYLGQVCIGWTLGTKFQPNFFKTAPRLLLATVVCVMVHLILTVIVSLSLASWTGINVAILGLGFSPGGVAEMTITAKTLQLRVPFVTMLHVIRMIAVISTAGILYRYLSKLRFTKDQLIDD